MKKLWDFILNLFTKKEPSSPKPKVLWEENFKSLSLSTAKKIGAWRSVAEWQPLDRGYEDFAGNSWNVNPNEPGAKSPFSVNDGILSINCVRRNDRWEGGILITEKTFGYGYAEARIRFPKHGRGMFPAFWMYSAFGSAAHQANFELDIMEVSGTPSMVGATVHTLDESFIGDSIELPEYPVIDTAWHTYGVDWQKDSIRFYRDGKLYASTSKAVANRFAGLKMTIRLNYSMDADWFPVKSDITTPDVLTMEVDYVRVTEKIG